MTSTPMEPVRKPQLPAKTPEDIIRQVTGNPLCKRYSCHGKGYVGIRINPDKSVVVILCECGRFGENDYVKLAREVQQLRDTVERLAVYFITKVDEIEEKTVRGTLVRWTQGMVSKVWKGKPTPATAPQIPIQGEVKA